MNMSDSADGESSQRPMRERLYAGPVENTKDPQSQSPIGTACGESPFTDLNSSEKTETQTATRRKEPRDFRCKTFAFIGGEEPHFIFSTIGDGWGRLYVSDTQIALAVEDGAGFIGNLVRASGGT